MTPVHLGFTVPQSGIHIVGASTLVLKVLNRSSSHFVSLYRNSGTQLDNRVVYLALLCFVLPKFKPRHDTILICMTPLHVFSCTTLIYVIAMI